MTEGRPAIFRQRDIAAAIRAVERAGLRVVGVRVDKDGFEVKTAPADGDKQPAAEVNEWDAVL